VIEVQWAEGEDEIGEKDAGHCAQAANEGRLDDTAIEELLIEAPKHLLHKDDAEREGLVVNAEIFQSRELNDEEDYDRKRKNFKKVEDLRLRPLMPVAKA